MLGASGGEGSADGEPPWATPFPPVPGGATVRDRTAGQGRSASGSTPPGSTPSPGSAPPGPSAGVPSDSVEVPAFDVPGWSQPTSGTTTPVAPHPGGASPDRAGVGAGAGHGSVANRVAAPLLLAALVPMFFAIAAVAMLIASEDLALEALVVVVIGLVGGSLGAFIAWRRLRKEVDLPARALQEAAARLGAGEPVEQVGGAGAGPLAPVAAALGSAGAKVSDTTDRLMAQARWGEGSRRILDALDFARSDAQVNRVVSEALELVDDEHAGELLMSSAESSGTLESVAANRATGSPGCPVSTAGDCMAIRRGQVVITDSSEAINACPQLRGRPYGATSAVCVPVSIEGHGLGVIHTTGPDRDPPNAVVVERLSELSRHLGARLASLHAIESSRAEASTDGLTGLPNRRSLEASLQQMLDSGRDFVAVLADLDKFKSLNDNFGHEAGDRALQLFARVMQDNVRGHDLVARVGGEEFVVAYPDMTVQGSIEAIERLRTGLASAVSVAAVQPFTCSFGVTHSAVGSSVGEILRVADAGLLRAKELGGDQVVYADQALAVEVFDNGEPPRPR